LRMKAFGWRGSCRLGREFSDTTRVERRWKILAKVGARYNLRQRWLT